jgi:hypothetical protein
MARDLATDGERRELAHRTANGIAVTLFWQPADGAVVVEVHDESAATGFQLHVSPARALDAFRHPYAYAAQQGIEPRATAASAPAGTRRSADEPRR